MNNISREELKEIIKKFVDRADLKNSTKKIDIVPKGTYYKNFEINISFGYGNFAKIPYINFLKYNQKTQMGTYPIIHYITDKKKLEVFLQWSKKKEAKVSEDKKLKLEDITKKIANSFNLNTVNLDDILDKLINNLDLIMDKFDDTFSNNEGKKMINNIPQKNNMEIKNIILYGSAGVGKTYNHKKIIALIEKEKPQNEIFKAIQENEKLLSENEIEKSFEIIKNENRFEFITFHQSFSYEDFIEGFRPNEKGKIELQNGIFKEICKRAEDNKISSNSKRITIEEAFNILLELYLNDEFNSFKTFKGIEVKVLNISDKHIKIKPNDNEFYVKFSDLSIIVETMLKNTDFQLSNIKELNVKSDTKALSSYYFPIAKKVIKILNSSNVEVKQKNFYLVIDEINRGNISKIFGELITLLEEDKRDSYKVVLPYLKKPFSVPSNLYIIATMNSTDKSIALIDIALRRRFTFIKMLPNSDLIKYLKAKELFEKLNKEIKNDLGEDFLIGHSYFMKIENDEDLNFVIEYKIKPLIEEYYYSNSERKKEIFENILNIKISI